MRQQNLSRWLIEAGSLPGMVRPIKSAWRVEQKARILADAAALSGEQLRTFLAEKGASLAEFQRWKSALEDDEKSSVVSSRQIRKLERELQRKEKALAEAAAKNDTGTLGGRARRHRSAEREVIFRAIAQAHAAGARLGPACRIAGLSVRTIERWRREPRGDDRRCGPYRQPGNALREAEHVQILALLTSSRYAHLSPKQLVPQLADEGLYLASESTLYRLQRRFGLRSSRRPVTRTDVTRASTVHRATRPNQVWSWDITWLPTPVRGIYLHLYLAMDVWSRRILGWRIARGDSAVLAAEMITQACRDGQVDPQGLVLHSDNGKPMRASTMLATLQWLGVVPSFSRPHVSDDNPYSEALFRTLKHTPAYPRLPFANRAIASQWVARFVSWYNSEHRHSEIRYVTPNERHEGREAAILARRHRLYQSARTANPERWSCGTRNWVPVASVVLNPVRTSTTVAVQPERQLP